jgi:hypothetical protein
MFAGPKYMSQTTSGEQKNCHSGTRTRVARVRAEYPNQLGYSGPCQALRPFHEPFEFRTTAILLPIIQEL